MINQDLFCTYDSQLILEKLPMINADLRYCPQFFDPARADNALMQLIHNTPWEARQIRVWGKMHWQPRLMAWYGDPDSHYEYSGLKVSPLPWTPLLSALRQDIEQATGARFNSVLLNYYRDGQDCMGMHSDDERELGPAPVIASLSLGQTRTMIFRPRQRDPSAPRGASVRRIDLPGGSLLLMAGTTQRYWQHGIDREPGPCNARINLTFRMIYPRGHVEHPVTSESV